MLCICGLAARAEGESSRIYRGPGENAEALMAKGDEFDKRLQAKEALEAYLPANKLWFVSRGSTAI